MDNKDLSIDNLSENVKKESAARTDNPDISFKPDNSKDNKKSISEMELDELMNFTNSANNALDKKSEAVSKVVNQVKAESPNNKDERAVSVTDNTKSAAGTSNNEIKAEPAKSNAQENNGSASVKTTSAAKPPKKKKSVSPKTNKSKKKKKKKGSRFNGSIFGGIIIVTLILTVSMVLAVGGITIGMEYYGIGKSDNDISFNIPQGSTNEEIASQLKANGIIKNEKLFLLALKVHNPETIFPGDITLQPSLGYSGVIDELQKMRESYETVTITFKEGENLLDIAAKLEENGVCEASDFLFDFNKSQDFDFEKKIPENENTFYAREGYFFPDTYEFYVGDTSYNITKIVREHFEKQVTEKMYTRMDKLHLDLNQVMTLASMVQLEARNVDEMPTVASVFLNRLDDSDTFPMLQSDPTKNYVKNVIASQSDNQATIEHYTEYYDTYQCVGLPAGPICNPGLDAIMAVLYPDDTDYYYFCNDLETGESFYAKTLEEHEKNLKKAGLA